MPILKKIKTPFDVDLFLATTELGICLCDFEGRKNLEIMKEKIEKISKEKFIFGEHFYLKEAKNQLEEYFAKERKNFDLPFHIFGTDFQKKVWEILLKIPYGQTISYQEQAVLSGNPKAQRAVANANGQNSLAIMIPCHRVIGKNGTLRGYGGGLALKKNLLIHEQQNL